jgi:hypothetical protein
MLKKKRAKKKPWQHTGGGCGLNTAKYPCDDSYENASTQQRIAVLVTKTRHFNMPSRIATPSNLKRLTGVGTIKKY